MTGKRRFERFSHPRSDPASQVVFLLLPWSNESLTWLSFANVDLNEDLTGDGRVVVPDDLGLLLPKWFGQAGGVAEDVSVELMRRTWLQTWGWVEGHEAAADVGWPERDEVAAMFCFVTWVGLLRLRCFLL